MRSTFLSTALAATLAVMGWLPGRADAQVVIYPTMSYSPYTTTSYYPGYNYSYVWTNPYYTTYSSAWTNPYNYGTWTWATPNRPLWYNTRYINPWLYPRYNRGFYRW